MHKTFIILTLCFFGFTASAQKVNVYNTFGIGWAGSSQSNHGKLVFGEMLQLRGPIPLRIIAGSEIGFNGFKAGPFKYLNTEKVVNINRNINQLFLAIPIGLELNFKYVGIGASQEILSLNFDKTRDSTFVEPEAYLLETKAFSGILSKNANLNSQVYVTVNLSDMLTIKAGFRKQNSYFSLFNKEDEKLGILAYRQALPFIDLRFNFEK